MLLKCGWIWGLETGGGARHKGGCGRSRFGNSAPSYCIALYAEASLACKRGSVTSGSAATLFGQHLMKSSNTLRVSDTDPYLTTSRFRLFTSVTVMAHPFK
jgi:hypothetical protein